MQQINEQIDASHIKLELAQETLDLNAKAHANDKKSLIEHKKQLAAEIIALRHRIEAVEEAVAPVLRAYDYSGVPYVHPRDILAKVNLDRADRILEYRELLQPQFNLQQVILQEEEKGLMEHRKRTAEIEEARHQQKLLMPKPPTASAAQTIASHEASRQYQRFQELLEKKLTMPTAGEGGEATPKKEMGFIGGSSGLGHRLLQGKQTSPAPPASLPPAPSGLDSPPPASSQLQHTPKPPTHTTGSAADRAEPEIVPGCTLKALFTYRATQSDELSFAAGDRIICLAPAAEEGWYSGISNQRTGLFPSNYVTLDRPD